MQTVEAAHYSVVTTDCKKMQRKCHTRTTLLDLSLAAEFGPFQKITVGEDADIPPFTPHSPVCKSWRRYRGSGRTAMCTGEGQEESGREELLVQS